MTDADTIAMDLNAPLGRKPPSSRPRVLPIAAATVAAVGLVTFGIYLLRADPKGGEPFAVAEIPPPPVVKPATPPAPAAPDPMPTGSIAPSEGSRPDTTTIENGVRIVSPSQSADAPRNGPVVIDVSKALDGDHRRTAPRGKTADGIASVEALPKVVSGLPQQSGATARPRVAIFVGGLGLSDIPTRTAIETMPAAVDLAFVPYGKTLAASVEAARGKGHEILLQLPMSGGRGAAPGPHALTADETDAERSGDLAWLMGRLGQYAGVTNLLGAGVTSNSDAMTAVLKAVNLRGAFYVDDGTSRASVAARVGSDLGMRVAQADVVLDATGDPAVVRANLERLVAIAKAKGSAIGMASALSDHVAAVGRFASALDARGIALVPVSAIARGGPSVATTR